MVCKEGAEYQNGAARKLVDEAEGEPFGKNRRKILAKALRVLEAGREDDFEARAVVLAMLAQEDAGYLAEAGRAFEESIAHCVQLNWIRLHLAEAWHGAGRPDEALRLSSSVQREYFDDNGLHWRSVRMDEIRAVALLRLGRAKEGVEAALAICDELTLRGDADDLSPPRDLAEIAVAIVAENSNGDMGKAGCAILHAFSTSVELISWFTPALVQRITTAMIACE
jgi:hypothetical protein